MREAPTSKKPATRKIHIANTPANNLLMLLGGALLILWIASWVDGGALRAKAVTAKSYSNTQKTNYEKALSTNLELHAAQQNSIVLEKEFNQLVATKIPKITKIDDVLEDITKIGTGLGLKVVFFKPEEVKKSNFFSQTPVSISVIGDYHHMAQFISGVANLPYLLTIRDFEITRESPTANLSMKMTVIVVQYLAPTETPVGGEKK